jgi:hypothetical protein
MTNRWIKKSLISGNLKKTAGRPTWLQMDCRRSGQGIEPLAATATPFHIASLALRRIWYPSRITESRARSDQPIAGEKRLISSDSVRRQSTRGTILFQILAVSL